MFTREDIEVAELVTGHSLSIPVFRYHGNQAGPKVHIQANVHGAELQGNAVIFALMQLLEETPIKGQITLIPHANPLGENYKLGEYTYGRFDPVTGDNWNRAYWQSTCSSKKERKEACQVDLQSFAEQHRNLDNPALVSCFKQALAAAIQAKREEVAQKGTTHARSLCLQLQALAVDADMVLDLHTASNATRYLYTPAYAVESALHMDMPHHLIIHQDFDGAMDEASFCPWWGLQTALSSLGRKDWLIPFEAFTLELGSQENINLETAKTDAAGLFRYLCHKGVLCGDPGPLRHRSVARCQLADYLTVFAPHSGLMEFQAQPGQPLRKGDTIGTILRFHGLQPGMKPEQALTTVSAPWDGIPLTLFDSSAITRGTQLVQMMTRVETVAVP